VENLPHGGGGDLWPRRASSPRIRLCPHRGFSRARRRTSFLIVSLVGGRPVRARHAE
jgi:hypothetical protein